MWSCVNVWMRFVGGWLALLGWLFVRLVVYLGLGGWLGWLAGWRGGWLGLWTIPPQPSLYAHTAVDLHLKSARPKLASRMSHRWNAKRPQSGPCLVIWPFATIHMLWAFNITQTHRTQLGKLCQYNLRRLTPHHQCVWQTQQSIHWKKNCLKMHSYKTHDKIQNKNGMRWTTHTSTQFKI